MQHLSPETRACVEECLRCHATCLGMAMSHCLEQGGKHVEPEHMRLMLACAEICQTAANFMLIGTPHHEHTCRECAEICEECARSKARSHTKTCSLEGHCLESGFGLVGEDGGVALLDSEATPKIIELVRHSPLERGIRARVARRERDGDMETVAAEELPSSPDASASPA